MTTYYKPTAVFIVAGIAVITAYDVWALAHGYERTISYQVASVAYSWPIVPFLFGVLAGHLFFGSRSVKDVEPAAKP